MSEPNHRSEPDEQGGKSLDVLAFAAHPDDVELCAGGTVALLAQQGHRVGVVDMTRGELGSRGTPELRAVEAAASARILGVSARVNLGLPDGGIDNTPDHRLAVIRMLRRYRPHIVLVNPMECRHPDHGAAARLVTDAVFYSGLRKIETVDGGPQEPWRPHHVLHYMQSVPFEPTFVVDVSSTWEVRMEAMRAFSSQFHNPEYAANPDEPQTFVSNPAFLEQIEAQARMFGYRIGAAYGEPFLYRHGPVGVTDLRKTLDRERPFR